MCGISGYLDFDYGVNCKTLCSMTDIIRHRGPDDEGYVLFNNIDYLELQGNDTVQKYNGLKRITEEIHDNYYLGFGHRRLSIIDLSDAGHQPMSKVKNGLFITFNGEIYNYIEVRKTLVERGYVFETETDTEVILNAYLEWGETCVDHFNGMWAFVIYDKNNHKLFCSRDRLGAKPFYYYINGNHMVFGSEIKQICQDNSFPHKLNEKILANTLVLRIQDYSEETLIEGIYSLSGGSNLIIKFDKDETKIVEVEKKVYWDLNISGEKVSDNEWYEQLKDGIRQRLRSDAPIGVMVSGGVDSSFLLNEVCKLKYDGKLDNSEPVDTFTTCYNNAPEHDETRYAHLVNEAWKAKEHLVYPDKQNTLDVYKKMIWHYEGLAPFSTMGSFMMCEEVAKSGVKVIINGQGGDESMLGYERYYACYLKDLLKRHPLKGVCYIRNIVKHSRLTLPALIKYMVYFGMPKIRIIRNKFIAKKLLSRDLINRFDTSGCYKILKTKNLDELIYGEIRKVQLTHILRMDDRGYMAYSLESRVPFIDYRYLEKAVRIDPMLKVKEGYTKYLLREKMVGTIPDEVIWRKNKNGWSSPAQRWMDRFDEKIVTDMISHPKAGKYFHMKYIKELWNKHYVCQDLEAFFFTEIFVRMFDLEC